MAISFNIKLKHLSCSIFELNVDIKYKDWMSNTFFLLASWSLLDAEISCYLHWRCLLHLPQLRSESAARRSKTSDNIMDNPFVVVVWSWKCTFYTLALDNVTLKNNAFKARARYKISNYMNKKKSFSIYPPPTLVTFSNYTLWESNYNRAL